MPPNPRQRTPCSPHAWAVPFTAINPPPLQRNNNHPPLPGEEQRQEPVLIIRFPPNTRVDLVPPDVSALVVGEVVKLDRGQRVIDGEGRRLNGHRPTQPQLNIAGYISARLSPRLLPARFSRSPSPSPRPAPALPRRNGQVEPLHRGVAWYKRFLFLAMLALAVWTGMRVEMRGSEPDIWVVGNLTSILRSEAVRLILGEGVVREGLPGGLTRTPPTASFSLFSSSSTSTSTSFFSSTVTTTTTTASTSTSQTRATSIPPWGRGPLARHWASRSNQLAKEIFILVEREERHLLPTHCRRGKQLERWMCAEKFYLARCEDGASSSSSCSAAKRQHTKYSSSSSSSNSSSGSSSHDSSTTSLPKEPPSSPQYPSPELLTTRQTIALLHSTTSLTSTSTLTRRLVRQALHTLLSTSVSVHEAGSLVATILSAWEDFLSSQHRSFSGPSVPKLDGSPPSHPKKPNARTNHSWWRSTSRPTPTHNANHPWSQAATFLTTHLPGHDLFSRPLTDLAVAKEALTTLSVLTNSTLPLVTSYLSTIRTRRASTSFFRRLRSRLVGKGDLDRVAGLVEGLEGCVTWADGVGDAVGQVKGDIEGVGGVWDEVWGVVGRLEGRGGVRVTFGGEEGDGGLEVGRMGRVVIARMGDLEEVAEGVAGVVEEGG
ncbi:hypothetical protein GE09DRAFT_1295370 [Coniochaeta sp. 2T2.1]|nr:hypothetical protein GE09DRAFT_1295370 [Coniochaeta sp. 2T2.1]